MTPDKELKSCDMPKEIWVDSADSTDECVYTTQFRPECVRYVRADQSPPLSETALTAYQTERLSNNIFTFFGGDVNLATCHSLAKHLTPIVQSPPLPDDVREAVRLLNHWPKVPFFKGRVELQRAIETLISAATQQPECVTVEEFKRRVNLYIDKNYPVDWGTAVMKEFPHGLKIVEG